MKKLLFGVFAHPDDEAFGPSGFLYDQAQNGTDVHLVLVTDGEAGTNEGYDDLGATRLQEWQECGKRMGVTSSTALHYPDGGLCNDMYLEIAGKVTAFITNTIAKYDEPLELEFLTFEQRGMTGHLDHIAVSFITTFVYEKLRLSPPENVTLGRLRYYCMPADVAPQSNCDWIYMPAGRTPEEVDEIFSYADIADTRLHIMQAHQSQQHDLNLAIENQAKSDKSDYFIFHKS